MKNILICLTIVFTAVSAFAQTEDPSIKESYIPPSPDAVSLGKFGDVPVSYYSGIPSINIPIGTMKGDFLSENVSISYHAGGIKVNDVSSVVGLGWALRAGGRIDRTVIGRADESDGGYVKNCIELGLCDVEDYVNNNQYMRQVVQGTMDAQPDRYRINFGPYSGEFYRDPYGEIHFVEQKQIKIENPGLGDEWIVYTPDGTKYIFDEVEKTYIENGCHIL